MTQNGAGATNRTARIHGHAIVTRVGVRCRDAELAARRRRRVSFRGAGISRSREDSRWSSVDDFGSETQADCASGDGYKKMSPARTGKSIVRARLPGHRSHRDDRACGGSGRVSTPSRRDHRRPPTSGIDPSPRRHDIRRGQDGWGWSDLEWWLGIIRVVLDMADQNYFHTYNCGSGSPVRTGDPAGFAVNPKLRKACSERSRIADRG